MQENKMSLYKSASINTERGWKIKYKNALEEANEKLVAAGIEPVKIYKDRKKKQKYEQLELDL